MYAAQKVVYSILKFSLYIILWILRVKKKPLEFKMNNLDNVRYNENNKIIKNYIFYFSNFVGP